MLIDISETYIHSNLHHYPTRSAPTGPTDVKEPTRSIALIMFLLTAYGVIHVPFILLSLVALLLRMSRPEDWPDMFGRWSDAYTLRRFWG